MSHNNDRMKRIIKKKKTSKWPKIVGLISVGLVVMALFALWILKGPSTSFNGTYQTFVISDEDIQQHKVVDILKEKDIVSYPLICSVIGSRMHIWDKLKAGKYRVEHGQTLISILRMLRNHKQMPVNLVINRLRTKEELAHLIGKNFAADSTETMNFLNSNESLQKYGVDADNAFTILIPDTYTFYWNTPLQKIFDKLYEAQQAFWNKNGRKDAAAQLAITPQQVYTLASIVEEETNYDPEKGKIASVYWNRLKKGMYLGADPTIKYALKDFGLRRILFGHLKVVSPYNTYKNKGLPPGPICTPTAKTIDDVLKMPRTDYLFFVASSEFNGTHHFSSNYAEHMQYAKAYQQQLDIYLANKH